MESLLEYSRGKIYKKVDSSPVEYLRFKDSATFQHRFLRGRWKNHPFFADDTGFELDWGNGDVFRCEWDKSTSSFTEIGRSVHRWETSFDHNYSDLGSTDGTEDEF